MHYEDGVVQNRRRRVIPNQLRRQILLSNHEFLFSECFTPMKLQRANQYYYWARMSIRYENHVLPAYLHRDSRDLDTTTFAVYTALGWALKINSWISAAVVTGMH